MLIAYQPDLIIGCCVTISCLVYYGDSKRGDIICFREYGQKFGEQIFKNYNMTNADIRKANCTNFEVFNSPHLPYEEEW